MPPTAVEATFVFADIAGFTALTEAHGDHDAAAVVADFYRSVRAEFPASGGQGARPRSPEAAGSAHLAVDRTCGHDLGDCGGGCSGEARVVKRASPRRVVKRQLGREPP
jgi:class 3 adenylate cyclase